jgi:N-methylhydantoinase B
MAQLGAVDLEIIKASLSGIVQEMQNSLFRTGFSTIVRESQDASCVSRLLRGGDPRLWRRYRRRRRLSDQSSL